MLINIYKISYVTTLLGNQASEHPQTRKTDGGTIAKYEEELQELEKSRKEILRKAKEDAERLIQESNARIESTIRIIKEAQADKERTQSARQELTDFKNQIEDIEKKNKEDEIIRKMDSVKNKSGKKTKRIKPRRNLPTCQYPKNSLSL